MMATLAPTCNATAAYIDPPAPAPTTTNWYLGWHKQIMTAC